MVQVQSNYDSRKENLVFFGKIKKKNSIKVWKRPKILQNWSFLENLPEIPLDFLVEFIFLNSTKKTFSTLDSVEFH